MGQKNIRKKIKVFYDFAGKFLVAMVALVCVNGCGDQSRPKEEELKRIRGEPTGLHDSQGWSDWTQNSPWPTEILSQESKFWKVKVFPYRSFRDQESCLALFVRMVPKDNAPQKKPSVKILLSIEQRKYGVFRMEERITPEFIHEGEDWLAVVPEIFTSKTKQLDDGEYVIKVDLTIEDDPKIIKGQILYNVGFRRYNYRRVKRGNWTAEIWTEGLFFTRSVDCHLRLRSKIDPDLRPNVKTSFILHKVNFADEKHKVVEKKPTFVQQGDSWNAHLKGVFRESARNDVEYQIQCRVSINGGPTFVFEPIKITVTPPRGK